MTPDLSPGEDGSTARLSTATYVAASAAGVWDALTNPEHTSRYWAHDNVSTWVEGDRWEHRRLGGGAVVDVAGTVLRVRHPHCLEVTWANPYDGSAVNLAGDAHPPQPGRRPSVATFDLSELGGTTRLRITHRNLASERERDALAEGWLAVLANLKTYLETGRPLPTPPWEMLPGFVRR